MKTAEEIMIESSLTHWEVTTVYPWQIESMKKYAKQVAEQLLKDVACNVYNAPLHEWEEISEAINSTKIQLP